VKDLEAEKNEMSPMNSPAVRGMVEVQEINREVRIIRWIKVITKLMTISSTFWNRKSTNLKRS